MVISGTNSSCRKEGLAQGQNMLPQQDALLGSNLAEVLVDSDGNKVDGTQVHLVPLFADRFEA